MNERILKYAKEAEFTNRDILMLGDNFQRFAELLIEDACSMMLSLEPMYPANLTVKKIREKFEIKQDREAWQKYNFPEIKNDNE
jgi:hypothetical protein